MKFNMFLVMLSLALSVVAGCGEEKENLFLNGDFEELNPRTGLPRDWATFARPGETLKISEQARTGRYALETDAYIIYQNVNLEEIAGKKYSFSGYFKSPDGGSVYMVMDFRKADGTIERKNVSKTTVLNADWQEIKDTITFPEDALELARIYIYFSKKGTLLIDSMELKEL